MASTGLVGIGYMQKAPGEPGHTQSENKTPKTDTFTHAFTPWWFLTPTLRALARVGAEYLTAHFTRVIHGSVQKRSRSSPWQKPPGPAARAASCWRQLAEAANRYAAYG